MNKIIMQFVNKIPNVEGYEFQITAAIASIFVIILAAIAFIITKRVIVHLINTLFTKTTS